MVSFLGRELVPGFGLRLVVLAPGETRRYDAAEWTDALVVVEQGTVELVGRAARQRFERGAVLALAGLPLVGLHNPGPEPTTLTAVVRSRAGRAGRRRTGPPGTASGPTPSPPR